MFNLRADAMPLLQGAGNGAIGSNVSPSSSNRTYQAVVSGAGAVSATVVVEGSNDGQNFIQIGTITLTGTNVATDGFVSNAAWRYVRARVTAASGGTVNAYVGF